MLLQEEFVASERFCSWFLQQIKVFDEFEHDKILVKRSVTDTYGESDLELTFQDLKLKILIENKVDASFQKDQAQRYSDRALKFCQSGDGNKSRTVLVAPKHYGNNELCDFEHRVNYEEILTWYKNSDIPKNRVRFKNHVLETAINKAFKNYDLITDEENTDFWISYYNLMKELYPYMILKDPGPKPSGSYFIYMRKQGFPKTVKIYHKFPKGIIDLEFPGMGDSLDAVIDSFKKALPSNYDVVKTNKSASIRVEVPKLTLSFTFDDQNNEIKECMKQAVSLADWYLQNKELQTFIV
ncbi:hypothetical protein LNTAR_15152 [Lentisphaera araneosa HTCC2155]|uniref:PD-(D/E)XK nuclease superfamily protein n=2 Tax=Lentisphaera TaxID=256846 RepID=A6DRF5_9BACT|nr:hypothetical protein LNTAR_15152 [Lentisphaera araneosa HTCC2155]